MSNPKPYTGDQNEAQKAAGGLVVSGREAAAVLKFREATFDQISQSVNMAIDLGLDLSIPFWRDDRYDVAFSEISQDRITIVSFVSQENLWDRTVLRHERTVAFHIGHLAATQDDSDRETYTVRPEVDFGREATS